MEDRTIKILVSCHKPCELPDDPMYLPVQVGHAVSGLELGIQPDDSAGGGPCDNISRLNGIYCEMTGLYWAWRNIDHVFPGTRYIGLCHYRRYFAAEPDPMGPVIVTAKRVRSIGRLLAGSPNPPSMYDPAIRIPNLQSERFARSSERLRQVITGSDIVATKPVIMVNGTVRTLFDTIGREHVRLLEEIVCDDWAGYHPILEALLDGNTLNAANMVVMRRDVLDDYCAFVFDVLARHVELTRERGVCPDPETDGSYSRVSGYLAELLTCTYVRAREGGRVSYVGKYFVGE